jgi:hypothetical protein
MSFRTSRQSRSLGASAARTSIRGRYATRLRLGSYIADIVPDDHEQPVIYHCVVQKIGLTGSPLSKTGRYVCRRRGMRPSSVGTVGQAALAENRRYL